MIPIYKPYFTENSMRYAHDAIDSTWVSSTGKYIKLATEKLKNILNVKYVQLVNNGTSATHLVAKSLIFKNPKIKKVIVPNNVYVAAWNSFLYENIDLLPIDACLESWNINYQKIPEIIDDDTGICLVNNLGNTIDTSKFIDRYGINNVVEDNCEGFMGVHKGIFSGTLSLASSLSFFGNKTITSGEGGAFVTNDGELYEYINKIQGQGQKSGEKYIHDVLGYNYRMTNIQAAILLGQLEILPEILQKKKHIFNFYRNNFKNMCGVRIQTVEKNTEHSNWIMGVRILGNQDYKNIKSYLSDHGIDSRPMFFPMSRHKHLVKFSNKKFEINALKLSRECVLLPSYPSMTDDELRHIVNTIYKYTKEIV